MSNPTAPLISIGIPTYNRPEGLCRTLTEITNQTYRNLDIIVSDNASPTEGTEKVVREFMRSDQRIKYIKQATNLGIHQNFQFVLEKAQGEYFIWCADDDWHEPEFIESLLGALSVDGSFAMAFCDFDIRNENGMPVKDYPDSHAALRLMTGSNSLIRQLRFFMLAEGRAIPHAIYGLLPTRTLRKFSWVSHVQRYGEYGADVLFIFWLLGQGRLALVERKLFGCTINNRKHYGSMQRHSLSDKLHIVIRRVGYIFAFVKVAKGWTRGVLLCVLPFKLVEVFYSMIVREPLLKVMRMLRGHS